MLGRSALLAGLYAQDFALFGASSRYLGASKWKIFLNLPDDLGPAKIVHIYDPKVGLKAVVAIDNAACGLAIGGIRMRRT